MVKSANDMAVVLAEGVAGSIEKFADEMNQQRAAPRHDAVELRQSERPAGRRADHLGARPRHPGARADPRVSANTTIYWHIPAIRLGKKVMRNYNTLIGRYPGADGMKTGFICASGFNLVATATRDGKRLIAVVLGAPSSAATRALKAAQLLEHGFSSRPAVLADALARHRRQAAPINAAPPNLRDEMCGAASQAPGRGGRGRRRSSASVGVEFAPMRCSCRACARRPARRRCCRSCSLGDPIVVYTGPRQVRHRRDRAEATPARRPRAGQAKRDRQSGRAALAASRPTSAGRRRQRGRTPGEPDAAAEARQAPRQDRRRQKNRGRPKTSQASRQAPPRNDGGAGRAGPGRADPAHAC